MKAYRYWEDGKQWLRIITDTEEWDEPITGWAEIILLCEGRLLYRNLSTGLEIPSA